MAARAAMAALIVLVGAALNMWVLSLGYNAGELPWRPIVPFGLLEIVVVQVAASAPLGWFMSRWFEITKSSRFNLNLAAWIIIGCALSAAILWFGHDISRVCEMLSSN
ncbi:MAG TPA: hypothetical protein VGJ15_04380, partial [Pirellulales bacterium]